MSTNIGSPEWIENVTKAALNNRANQLNPNNGTYWKCRDCKPATPVNPLLAVVAAAAIGASVTAAAILGIQKYAKYRKDKDGKDKPDEGCDEVLEENEEIILEDVTEKDSEEEKKGEE